MTEKPIVDPKLAQELFEIVENRGELRMFTAPMVTNIEPPDIQLFCHSETCRTDSAELYQALDEEKKKTHVSGYTALLVVLGRHGSQAEMELFRHGATNI